MSRPQEPAAGRPHPARGVLLLVAGVAAVALGAWFAVLVLYLLGVLALVCGLAVLVWRRWSRPLVVALAGALAAAGAGGPALLAWWQTDRDLVVTASAPEGDYQGAGSLLVARHEAVVVVPADGTTIVLQDPRTGDRLASLGGVIEAVDPASGVLATTADHAYWYHWDDDGRFGAPVVVDRSGPKGAWFVAALTADRLVLAACTSGAAQVCTVTGYDRAGEQLWQLEEVSVPAEARLKTRLSTDLEGAREMRPPPTTLVTGYHPFLVRDLDTGEVLGQLPGDADVLTGDLLVTTRADGAASCHVTATRAGEVLWEKTLTAAGCAEPTMSTELLVLQERTAIVALDLDTGEEYRWTRQSGGVDVVGYAAVYRQYKEQVAVDLRTGAEIWRQSAARGQIAGDLVLMVDPVRTVNPFVSAQAREDGWQVTVRQATSGEVVCRLRSPGSVHAAFPVDGGLAVLETGGGLSVYGDPVDPRPVG